MSSIEFTKENTIPTMIRAIRRGQKMGAYEFADIAVLHKAIQVLNPEGEKAAFDTIITSENTALIFVIQGIQKAQAHGGNFAFSVEEAALLSEIIDFYVKLGVAGTGESSKKQKKNKIEQESDDEDDDDDEQLKKAPAPLVDPRKAKSSR